MKSILPLKPDNQPKTEYLESLGELEIKPGFFSSNYKASLVIGDYNDVYLSITAKGDNLSESINNLYDKLHNLNVEKHLQPKLMGP